MAVSVYEKEICNSEHGQLAKICQGFGKYSNEMARGALVKWRILAKMWSLTNSAESGKNGLREYSNGMAKGALGKWEFCQKWQKIQMRYTEGAPFEVADSRKVVLRNL